MPKRKRSQLTSKSRCKRSTIMKNRTPDTKKSLKDLCSTELNRVNSALDAAVHLGGNQYKEEDEADDKKRLQICPKHSSASAESKTDSVIWDRKKRNRLATAMKLLEFVEGNLDDTVSSVDWADDNSTVRAMGRLLPADYFGVCDDCRSRCRSCGRRSSRCGVLEK